MSLHPILKRIDLPTVLAIVIVMVSCYLTGSYLTGAIHPASRQVGAMWAAASGVMVLQADIKSSLANFWKRVLGTLIGAVIAYLYSLWFTFSPIGMAISVFFIVIICMLLDIPDKGRFATLNMVVILIISLTHPGLPPAINCILRFSEATTGSILGLSLSWIILKLPKRNA